MISQDDNRICVYCDITEAQYRLLKAEKDQPLTLTKDHIEAWKPVGKGSVTAWACCRCNLVKNHTFNFDEMREVGQKYIKPMWKRIAQKKLEDLRALTEFINGN